MLPTSLALVKVVLRLPALNLLLSASSFFSHHQNTTKKHPITQAGAHPGELTSLMKVVLRLPALNLLLRASSFSGVVHSRSAASRASADGSVSPDSSNTDRPRPAPNLARSRRKPVEQAHHVRHHIRVSN